MGRGIVRIKDEGAGGKIDRQADRQTGGQTME